MMRLYCLCGHEFGRYPADQIAAALLQAHATNPHSAPGHGLHVEPMPEGEVEVRIECQHATCKGQQTQRWRVPAWFAAGVVIVHHSSHEGHGLRVWLDGAEVVPC